MFTSLFRKKEIHGDRAEINKSATDLYAQVLQDVRDPFFYNTCKVSDTFDGRFDLLLLHSFLVLNRLLDHPTGQALSQAYFDAMFRDMDQTLREMGIGDMGIPKHMKKMMKAFNGRMHSYRVAMSSNSDNVLQTAIRRNLYGSLSHPSDDVVKIVCDFVRLNMKEMNDVDDLLVGYVSFSRPSVK